MALGRDEWSRYQKLVLSELSRLSDEVKTNNLLLRANETEIEKLKVRAGVFGAIGATATTIVLALIKELFLNRSK